MTGRIQARRQAKISSRCCHRLACLGVPVLFLIHEFAQELAVQACNTMRHRALSSEIEFRLFC